MSEVELLVGGKLYAGWKDAAATRAMDAAAGTFQLSVSDRWTPNSAPWFIQPGDECELRIDGETVISGYVDLVRPAFSPSDHSIEVQGRDKSGDLVDCSAVHSPDEWKGITLLQLAQKLAQPFGIMARAEVDVGGALPLVKLQHGETVIEAIERHARMRKVLVMPDGRGGILLTRTGVRRATVELVQGENIIEASGTLDWSERYSVYIVKGQSRYSSDTDGETEAHASATVRDPTVTRYRPLMLITSAEASNASAKERATWEANTRLGRSAQATITVQGWRQTPGGALWEPNTLVRIRSGWLGMDGDMLIRQVTYTKGPGGTLTKLDVVSPSAYEVEPPDERKSKKKKGSGQPWDETVSDDVKAWMDRIGAKSG